LNARYEQDFIAGVVKWFNWKLGELFWNRWR